MMEDFVAKFNEVWKALRDYDSYVIKVIMCMIMEETCKRDGSDMVETMEELLDAARFVNEKYGKY